MAKTHVPPMRFQFVIRCAFGLALGNLCQAEEVIIRTVAGTGHSEINRIQTPVTTNVGNPFGVEIGPDGALYFTEVSNHRVWRLDRKTNQLSVVAGCGQAGYDGDGGPATSARMNEPYEVRFDSEGHCYVVEMRNHIVRRVDRHTGVITTVAGTGKPGFGGDGGPARKAALRQPHSIALDGRGQLYIADIGNHRIRQVDLKSGRIQTLAGNGEKQLPEDGQPGADRPVYGPRALYLRGDTLWVALREGNSIWRLDLAGAGNGVWHHVAGTGKKGYSGDGGDPARATFNGPKGIAVGPDGRIFVTDTENQAVRVIDLARRRIDTMAGRGPDWRGFHGENQPATAASLNRPHGICVDAQGVVYIGDSENHRVRVLQ